MAGKDEGLNKLAVVCDSGEKLYPETSATGRDKIRSQLRTAKEVWESLMNNCSEMQRKLDAKMAQWSVHKEGVGQLVQWLADTEASLQSNGELRSKLEEKKKALQQAKVNIAYCSHQQSENLLIL